MVETFSTITEQFSDMLTNLGPILIGFLLLSGYLHLRGKQSGFELENKFRIAGDLPVLHLQSAQGESVVPWKDPALLRGGLTALVTMVGLSTYVLFMLLWTAVSGSGLPTKEQLLFQIPPLMTYPVTMAALVIFGTIKAKSKRYGFKNFRALTGFTGIPALLSWVIPWVISPAILTLTVQSVLLIIVALCLSFSIGLQDGFNNAQIEKKYPVIDAALSNGTILNSLRLIASSGKQYHFLTASGQELLIPAAKVDQISHPSAST